MTDYRDSHQPAARAAAYEEEIYAPGTWDSWIWEREQAVVPALVRAHCPSPRRYLDFACGTGRVLSLLAPEVDVAEGIDVSDAMLRHARAKVPAARLVHGDVTTDPTLLDGPYDLITAFRFFVNAQPSLRDQAVAVLRRLVAEDGCLVCNVHANRWSLRLLTSTARRIVLRQRLAQVSLSDMERLLARHRFRIVEVRGLGLVNRTLYRVVGRRGSDGLERWAQRHPRWQRFAVNLVIVATPI